RHVYLRTGLPLNCFGPPPRPFIGRERLGRQQEASKASLLAGRPERERRSGLRVYLLGGRQKRKEEKQKTHTLNTGKEDLSHELPLRSHLSQRVRSTPGV